MPIKLFAIDQILSQITNAALSKQQNARSSNSHAISSTLSDGRRHSSTCTTQNTDILIPNISNAWDTSEENLHCPLLSEAAGDSITTSLKNKAGPLLCTEPELASVNSPVNDVTDNVSVQCNEFKCDNVRILNFGDELSNIDAKVSNSSETDENRDNFMPHRKISRFLVSPVFEQNVNADQENTNTRRTSVEMLNVFTSVESTDLSNAVSENALVETDNNEAQILVIEQLQNVQQNQAIDNNLQFYHVPEAPFNDVDTSNETLCVHQIMEKPQIVNNLDQIYEKISTETHLDFPVPHNHSTDLTNSMFQASESNTFIPQTISNQNTIQQYPLQPQQLDVNQSLQINNNLLALQQLQLQLVNDEKNRRISNHSNTSNMSSDSQLSEISFTSDEKKVPLVLVNTPVLPLQVSQFLNQDASNSSLSPHMNTGDLSQSTAVIHQNTQSISGVSTLTYSAQSGVSTESSCKAKTKEVSSTLPDLAQNLANILSNPKSKSVTPHTGSSHEQGLSTGPTVVLTDYKSSIHSEQYFQPIHSDASLQTFSTQKCIQGSSNFPQNNQCSHASQVNNQILVQQPLPPQQSIEVLNTNILQNQCMGNVTEGSVQNQRPGSSYGSAVSQNSIQPQSMEQIQMVQSNGSIQQIPPTLIQPHVQTESLEDQHQLQHKSQDDCNSSKFSEIEGSLDCNNLSR